MGGQTAGRLVVARPVHDDVRFRFELPERGEAGIDVFDLSGRSVGRVDGTWGAGVNEARWSARGIGPGVYFARLTQGKRSEVLRFVRVR